MAAWKDELKRAVDKNAEKKAADDKAIKENEVKVKTFFGSVVVPAFKEVKAKLEKNGRTVRILEMANNVSIIVSKGSTEEFNFSIDVGISPFRAFPRTLEQSTDRKTGRRFSGESSLRMGAQDYDVTSITKDEIVKEVVRRYADRINYP